MWLEMRAFALITILVLVAGMQCVSACTLAACSEAQKPGVPPCHQEKTPAPEHPAGHDHSTACSHQKVTDDIRPVMPDLPFVTVASAQTAIENIASVDLANFFRPPLIGPPLLATTSTVLRI